MYAGKVVFVIFSRGAAALRVRVVGQTYLHAGNGQTGHNVQNMLDMAGIKSGKERADTLRAIMMA